MTILNLYEEDFYAWTQEQVKLLKEKTLDKLDLKHLCEEVESMGASERSELVNRLKIIYFLLVEY